MATYYIGRSPVTPYLKHFGIQGQKWGVRRYQNLDGSLTEEGKARYGYGSLSKNSDYSDPEQLKRAQKGWQKAYGERWIDTYNYSANKMNYGIIERYNKKWAKENPKWDKDVQQRYEEEYGKLFDTVMYKTASQKIGDLPGVAPSLKKEMNDLLIKYGEEPMDW